MKADSSHTAAQSVVKPRALTRRQQRFIASYLRCYNATKAALEAGYSQKTAYSIGHENRHKPVIKAIIDAELNRRHQEWLTNPRREQLP